MHKPSNIVLWFSEMHEASNVLPAARNWMDVQPGHTRSLTPDHSLNHGSNTPSHRNYYSGHQNYNSTFQLDSVAIIS